MRCVQLLAISHNLLGTEEVLRARTPTAGCSRSRTTSFKAQLGTDDRVPAVLRRRRERPSERRARRECRSAANRYTTSSMGRDGPSGEVSSVARERASSRISTLLERAGDGAVVVVPLGASTNAASSMPGTVPVTSSFICVIPVPGTNVDVAVTSSFSGALPACARAVRQRHGETGGVRRRDQLLGARPAGLALFGPRGPRHFEPSIAPLPVDSMRPEPSMRLPLHVTRAVRSATTPSPPLCSPPS